MVELKIYLAQKAVLKAALVAQHMQEIAEVSSLGLG